MDKRTKFREMNTRKLKTYADMAGMTIYRDRNGRITELSYEDYSFGDPDEAWREREELFGSDPDEERLPDKTCDRYFIDYWKAMGGPYRLDGGHYKTKEDIENEIEEKKAKAGRRAEAARLKAEAKEAEALKRRQMEFIEWDRKQREKKRKIAKAKAEEKERIAAAEWKRHHRPLPPPIMPPAPSRREADPFAFDMYLPVQARYAPRPPHAEQEARDRQYQETLARRLRQKEAMDSGREFSSMCRPSSPQWSYMVTWEDPGITDIKLVRVVLGPYDTGSTRTMTAEEEADYWYWKARGK